MQQQQQQQQQGNATNAQGTGVFFASPARGVRRRREDSIEIEEIDTDTMRQNSYNYFERYARPNASAYNASGLNNRVDSNAALAFLQASRGNTSPSSLQPGSSRKRQRTLADHLEDLSLGGTSFVGRNRQHNSSNSSNAVGSADAATIDIDPSDDSDSGDSVDIQSSELTVYGGGVPNMKGFFFGSTRRRPMDRVFRHYAAVANHHHAASATEPNGNELVLYRRAPSPLRRMPRPTLSPQDLESLTRHEARKRVTVFDSSVVDENDADTIGSVSSGTNSPSFSALGVPRTDDVSDVSDISDVDMDGSYSHTPHASGEISHSEWFLDDEL